MPKCAIMVGVSTRQNTANLVPFIQFEGEKLLLLETDKARKDGWSFGISRILGNRYRDCKVVQIGNGTDLVEMGEKLQYHLKNEKSVCWNFGGGQKLQQLAMFNHFKLRIDEKFDDWACYAEPQTRRTFIITPASDKKKPALVNRDIATDCNLDLQEVFSIFDHQSPQNKLLWQRDGPDSGSLYGEQLLTETEDNWFNLYENRQKTFRFVAGIDDKDEKDEISFPESPIKFKPEIKSKDKFADYFERLVQTRIARVIADKPGSHMVNQVWANVHVKRFSGGDQIAEFDLVLVTNFGTLIPVDAKSFDFAKKDEDARLHNLNHLSGYYTKFWSVFPYYREDLQPDSVLQTNKKWSKLLNIPFDLQERKSNMLGLTRPGDYPIRVCRTKSKNIKEYEPNLQNNAGTIEIIALENIIESLQLSRKLD